MDSAGGSTMEKTCMMSQVLSELKTIEERYSKITSVRQIGRLLRPGAAYFNLNPFEVLQVDQFKNLHSNSLLIQILMRLEMRGTQSAVKLKIENTFYLDI